MNKDAIFNKKLQDLKKISTFIDFKNVIQQLNVLEDKDIKHNLSLYHIRAKNELFIKNVEALNGNTDIREKI